MHALTADYTFLGMDIPIENLNHLQLTTASGSYVYKYLPVS